MSQQQPNTAQQLLTLPNLNNTTDISIAGGALEPPPPRRRRRAVIIIAPLALLVVLAAALLYSFLGRQAPPAYQTTQVTQGNLALNVQATGPLQSPATYNLVAPTSGIIERIEVKVGQKVTKGQVLAQLDTTALQDAVNEALAAVNADVDALYNLEVSTGWVVTPSVTQAKDTLKIAQAQLTAAQHNLASATLRAPHAGVVTAINGTVGGTPGVPLNSSTGSAGGSYFIQIVDLASLQIVANVNEADTANLKAGDSVQFTVDAYGNRQFQGTVDTISASGISNSNVVSFPVTIDVDTQSIQGANLLPGMTAAVTITVLQNQNVLLVPASAVSFARSADNTSGGSPTLVSQQAINAALSQAQQILANLQNQKPAIAAQNPTAAFVIERSGSSYIARPVVLGITDGTSYEVLAGLSLNETILTGTGSGSNSAPPSGGSSSSGKGG